MKRIKVLFLAANPSTTSQSQLEAEVALILKELPLSEYQGRVEFVVEWASSIDDLREQFDYHRPHVVHFIGQNAAKGIMLVDSSGHLKPIEAAALYLVFADSLKKRIRLVILQNCYIPDQIKPKHGDSLAELVGCVIGISHLIDAHSATSFVINFYKSIIRGSSNQEAFNQGEAALPPSAKPGEQSIEIVNKKYNPADKVVLLPRSEASILPLSKKQLQGEEPATSALPATITLSSIESVDLFVVYAQEDQELQRQFMAHLNLLKNQGLIRKCYESNISYEKGQKLLSEHLTTAKVFLLLMSVDFINADFSTIQKAILRHKQGEAYVIPILLRSVYWEGSPFSQLPRLPDNNQSIIARMDRDAAFLEIVQSIRLVLEEQRPTIDTQKMPAAHPVHNYLLKEVFMASGIPNVTFVEGERFEKLKKNFKQRGRSMVIEGPSGIGKTTAIKKAIKDIQSAPLTSDTMQREITLLSALNSADLKRLETIETWHTSGTVVIDDFHHLDTPLSKKIVDHLKLLADSESETKKLVIVGIPQTGQKLVNLSPDIANRISTFRWGKEKNELILQMIEQGEQALNIQLKRKMEIAIMARGSLTIAQFLCCRICQQEQVNATLPEVRVLDSNISQAISNVIASLATKFETVITHFVHLGNTDSTCLYLLEELGASENGSLLLLELKKRRRELNSGIERFISEKWIDTLYEKHDDSKKIFFFDSSQSILMIEDPQLTFYLQQVMPYSKLARDAGIKDAIRQHNIFIGSCKEDTTLLKHLYVHLQPLTTSTIDAWDETRLAKCAEPERDLQTAITIAKIALVFVSADLMASNFVVNYQLHRLLEQAQTSGTRIITLVMGPCAFNNDLLTMFPAFNLSGKPVRELRKPDRETLWAKLTESIREDFLK